MGSQLRKLLIEVENSAFLTRCYGAPFANAVEAELLERITVLCGRRYAVKTLGAGRIGLTGTANDASVVPIDGGDTLARQAFAQALLLGLAEWAKLECGAASLAILNANWVTDDELHHDGAFPTNHWQQAPRGVDMEAAAEVYQAIGDGRIELVFQPIFSTEDLCASLYHQCLLRVRLDDGCEQLFPNSVIPSLERLGLMRCLDRYVMRRALSLLDEFEDLSLGVSISGQSSLDDVWWAWVFAELADTPHIAQRLVIELTDAQVYPVAGRQFCRRMRQLGCRIAIKGEGLATHAANDAHAADILKIAPAVFKRHCEAGQYAQFAGVLLAAHARADQVVVEGIESAEEVAFARESGVQWGQGDYVSNPGDRIRA
ncbi:hypothetical protein LMG19083_05029 [Ralstonia psammae]|uniref:EAL domain-containing protein n=1 Tax=Ralstonia psammae TaxID=3058598 RepID=A0ABN9JHY7_9RALS|nr:EAL domain-containing protein [Ralstonia sp. LMG 19083]CAJ0809809.1 hypothetical protein LMG19083_05029 [Ralstonia sp. LMG 19083]